MPPAAAYPSPLPALRHDRGPVWRALGRGYLKLAGWHFEGAFPDVPKCVLIVAPHTSNWDFLVGLAVVFALDLRASWLGKHTLFRAPFQGFLRWLGGIPVDRRSSNGVVGACVASFAEAPALWLALSPEGTRKGARPWKSGFYLIASGAGVPIVPVGFDYPDHAIRFMAPFQPAGDLEQDLPRIQGLFSEVRGLRP